MDNNKKTGGNDRGQEPPAEDRVQFAEEARADMAPRQKPPWKILVVDDDADVHTVTRLALSDFRFDDRPLDLRDAYTGTQAVDIMRGEPDIAVVLMDVVMESESAGLKAIDAIRKELGNSRTRIILRTGQPGFAPEDAVVQQFGINDYKEKTELTAARLKNLVHTRLADYQALADMEESAARIDNLEQVIHVLHRERSGLELLDHLTAELQACSKITELGALVATGTRALTGAPSGAVLLTAADGSSLLPVGFWGNSDGCGLRDKSDCPVLLQPNRGGAAQAPPPPCTNPEVEKKHLCIPISVGTKLIGVLQIIGLQPGSGDAALPLLETLASRTGLIVSNLLLRDRLQAQSVRDHLTGLFNRRFLTESLTLEVARSERRSAPFALAFFDLDHFKNINDRYGHPAGDAALVSFAKIVQQQVRSSDIPCRYGGEEFAVIMPGTTAEAAHERAELIRQCWNKASVPHAGGTLSGLSVSAGVAAFPHDAASPEELLRTADDALYRAKRQGRNRCERASVPRQSLA